MSVPEHFNNLIRKIAEEHQYCNYDLKIEDLSSEGANYTSKLYTVNIKEKNKELHLFAKVAVIGETMRAQMPNFYDTEIFVYTKLTNVYDRLQKDNNVPKEDRLSFTKFYGYNPNHSEETLVLEDLVAQGYSSYDRFKSVDWAYASSAVTEMAKIHALSLAYKQRHPQEFQKVIEKLHFNWSSNNFSSRTKQMFEKVFDTVNENNKGKLKAFFEKNDVERMMKLFKESKTEVLYHGDFRASNLMHRTAKDGKIEIKIVDLQTMQGGSLLVDLLYFIITGSDEQFRAAHFDQLINHYYTQLNLALKRLNLDPDQIYSKADFDCEFKEKLPFGLTIAALALPIVTVETEHAPSMNGETDFASFSMHKTSEMYNERLNGVVNDYVKWGILK